MPMDGQLRDTDSIPNSSEVEFRRLLERFPAAAYTCDSEGLITFFNERAVQLWGREPRLNDPLDRFCGSFQLFSPDGSAVNHAQCWMARTLKENKPYNGQEIVVKRPDGSRATVLAHANPFHDEWGRLAGAVNVLVDISDRKRAERLLSSIVAFQQEIATSELELQTVMDLIAERTQQLTGADGAVLELAEG